MFCREKDMAHDIVRLLYHPWTPKKGNDRRVSGFCSRKRVDFEQTRDVLALALKDLFEALVRRAYWLSVRYPYLL
jgi:hypothetical protein